MVNILAEDMPWVYGYYPQSYTLYPSWYRATKPNAMARNTLKYVKIDGKKRKLLQTQWNKPLIWPFALILAIFVALIIPLALYYRNWENKKIDRLKDINV